MAPNVIFSSPVMRAGLIGAGIGGSQSPFMHTTEARDLGLDLTYELFDLDGLGGLEAFPRILDQVRHEGYVGVNVTHPVKQTALRYLDSCSDDVALLGACNTVTFLGGKAIGHNTDWLGFEQSFRRGLPRADLDSVLLLGAGGAGSAVTYALMQMGAKRILVHEIDAARREAIIARFRDRASLTAVTDLRAAADTATGIVNCTPVGMAKLPGSPMSKDLLRPTQWVADIVYFPLKTQFIADAENAGCDVLDGGGMAVFQAAEAFRLFTGVQPNRERMLLQFRREMDGKTAEGRLDAES